MKKHSFGFYLLGQRAFSVLKSTIDVYGAGPIAWVVCGKDCGVADDHYAQIKALCVQHGISFMDRCEGVPDCSDVLAQFSIGWKWLIQEYENLVVFHDSLLPKYRGFAPLVNALIQGERQIGVSAIKADAAYDRGLIVGQEAHEVVYPARIADVLAATEALYQSLVFMVMGKLLAGEALPAVPQDASQASYSLWRDEDDYEIDWRDSSRSIRRFIDAVGHPFMGAKTHGHGRTLRILQAQEVDDVKVECREAHIGKVIFLTEGDPVVVCGTGLLRITLMRDEQTKEAVRMPFRTRLH